MRSERGVTLMTLIVYILLMTFIIAAISSITASFYSNINEFDKDSESAAAFSKFNMYFLSDIKRKNVSVVGKGENYIILSYYKVDESTGNAVENVTVEYSMQNNILYRNKVKICDNVDSIKITSNEGSNTIKVQMELGEYKKTSTYVIEKVY